MPRISDSYMSVKRSHKWVAFSRLKTTTENYVGHQFFLTLFRFRFTFGIDILRR